MATIPEFTATILSDSFEDVLARARLLTQEQRGHLLHVSQSLSAEVLSRDLSLRISTVRTLVALLPDSLATITAFVQDPRLYEIHFTLFCYLDWVPSWPDLLACKPTIRQLLETYLLTVKTDSGAAAWMAGDLLGDHWPPEESVPLLLNVFASAVRGGTTRRLTRYRKALFRRQTRPAK